MSNSKPSAYSIPPAGKVSALRQRMIDDMTVRNLAPDTMLCYLKQVHYLARYFHKSPEQLSPEDIREYQLYLTRDRKVSVNSGLVAMTALRFLYGVTPQRERFIEMLPMPRKEHYLPVILSPAEVLQFLNAPNFPRRTRSDLFTLQQTCLQQPFNRMMADSTYPHGFAQTDSLRIR